MYRLIPLLFFTSLFSQEILISYFDKQVYQENGAEQYDFTTNVKKEEIDTGGMLSFAYPINPSDSPLYLMGGTSISKWNASGSELYAYSTFLSARLSPLALLYISPYVELSLAGPTYLSNETLGDINFNSKVVYQNYISVGLKVATLMVDVRMINYSESLPTAFTTDSITLPLVLSLGISY
jgi:hypothetical protein